MGATTCSVVEVEAGEGEVAARDGGAERGVAGGGIGVVGGDERGLLDVEENGEDVGDVKVDHEQHHPALRLGREDLRPDTFKVLDANVADVGYGDPVIFRVSVFQVLTELKEPEHAKNPHAAQRGDAGVVKNENPS